jgi:hypothetical protein
MKQELVGYGIAIQTFSTPIVQFYPTLSFEIEEALLKPPGGPQVEIKKLRLAGNELSAELVIFDQSFLLKAILHYSGQYLTYVLNTKRYPIVTPIITVQKGAISAGGTVSWGKELKAPLLTLRGADLNLTLTGTKHDLTVPKFTLDFLQGRSAITFNGIDLRELLELNKQEYIEADGACSGSMQLVSGRQGFSVSDGKLLSDREGSIRYRGQPSGQQSLEFVQKAMSDFKYSHFSGDFSYLPDGNLTLKLRLEGKSPALNTERPVNVNLSLEKNLLSLYRVLTIESGVLGR